MSGGKQEAELKAAPHCCEDMSGQDILLGSRTASCWALCPILLQLSSDLVCLLFWDFPDLCHDWTGELQPFTMLEASPAEAGPTGKVREKPGPGRGGMSG